MRKMSAKVKSREPKSIAQYMMEMMEQAARSMGGAKLPASEAKKVFNHVRKIAVILRVGEMRHLLHTR